MQTQIGVQKLVSQLSRGFMLCGLGLLMLGTHLAFGSTPSNASKSLIQNPATSARIRQGTVYKKSPHNYISLQNFNSEFAVKVKEYQKVASYKSIESAEQQVSYKADGSEKILSGGVSVTQSQSMIDHKDGSKESSQSILFTLSGKVSDNYSVTGRISAFKDLKDTENQKTNDVSDALIVLSQKHVELAQWLKGGFSINTVLATSEYSRKFQNYQGSIGAAYTFALTDEVLAKGLKTSFTLGASRNFHEYETDAAGRIMNAYGMREILSTEYSIGDFAFSFEFIHRHAWNYEGSVSQAFEHTEEISYSVTPQWSVSMGHTNAGTWLAPNGQDSNLKLINENDSIVYGSMSLAF